MKRIIIYLSAAILMVSSNAKAQDIHFSQFYQTPLIVNPGLTGAFHGDHRVIINYKDQWRSINESGNTFTTAALSYDWNMYKKKWKNSFLGGGVSLIRDKAGDLSMGHTQLNLSLSSIVSLNENQRLSLGVQGGVAQKSIDFSNAQWDSQYDGSMFNSSLSSNENYTSDAFIFPDFSVGMAWSYGTDEATISSGDEFRANIGVAYMHLNRPDMKYDIAGEQLYSKMVIHGGSYIGLKNSVGALLPSAIFYMQGPQREIDFGLMFRYMVKEESRYTGYIKETAILLGGYYRVGDAFVPAVMLEFANFVLGVTYDINISGLKAATNARGGIEISLKFVNPNPFKPGEEIGRASCRERV